MTGLQEDMFMAITLPIIIAIVVATIIIVSSKKE